MIRYVTYYAKDKTIINPSWEEKSWWYKNTLANNWATVYHLSCCDGYQPFILEDYWTFFKKLRPEKSFSLLNIKYITHDILKIE